MVEKEKKSSKTNQGREIITSTLRYLANGITQADNLFGLWAGHSRSRKGMFNDKDYKRSSKRRLQYLKRKEFVRIKRVEGKLFIELSEKGSFELILRTLHERPKLGLNQVCLVAFDFPISSNNGRDAFRNFLKRAGFSKKQMSLWESDQDMVSDIQMFIDRAGIDKWVNVYLAQIQ